MHRTVRSIANCIFLFAFCVNASAQRESVVPCDVHIPLVVTLPDNSLVRALDVSDLTILLGGSRASAESLVVDSGTKRVVLIIDASSSVPEDEWNLQTSMASEFVGYARQGDEFSLLIVGEDAAASEWMSSATARDQLQKFRSSRPRLPESTEPIYDAILASVKRLDPPRFGDSIFIFGHNDDRGSKNKPDEIRELLVRRQLRLFGMTFADPLAGKLPPGFDPNKPLPPSFAPSTLERMTLATGNYFSFHQIVALNHPGQLALFKAFLGDLYARVAEPYCLVLTLAAIRSETKLEIEVTNSHARTIRSNGTFYSHSVYPCTNPSR